MVTVKFISIKNNAKDVYDHEQSAVQAIITATANYEPVTETMAKEIVEILKKGSTFEMTEVSNSKVLERYFNIEIL